MVHADIADVVGIEDQEVSSWSAKSLAAEMLVPNGCQLVAELTSCIVGWCCCRFVAPEAELLKFAVDKEYRRQGAGSLLFCFLVKELRRREIDRLFLEVRAANRAAIIFYEQQGFSQIGVRYGYYANPPDSALIFCKSIR